MNKTSTDKIKSATCFLIWFRRCLPQGLQERIRPYLDSPYQVALKVMDGCESTRPLTVGEIAQSAGVAYESARQVLQALREGGMPFSVSPTREWQIVPDPTLTGSLTSMNHDTDVQMLPEKVVAKQR
jgi:hypothetical protein